MNGHFLTNLRKAARAGLLGYANSDDWGEAALAVAKECATDGETAEQAFARLSKIQHHEVQQLEKMRQLSRDTRGRKPAPLSPASLSKSQLDAQERLNDMILRKVSEARISYEQAYAAVTATQEGRALWGVLR